MSSILQSSSLYSKIMPSKNNLTGSNSIFKLKTDYSYLDISWRARRPNGELGEEMEHKVIGGNDVQNLAQLAFYFSQLWARHLIKSHIKLT